jgi:hypothetical protein
VAVLIAATLVSIEKNDSRLNYTSHAGECMVDGVVWAEYMVLVDMVSGPISQELLV